jgi:hypothetical protein
MKLATSPELVCRDAVELASDYIEQAVGAETRARFEQHCLVCPPCSAYLAQLKRCRELCSTFRSGDDELVGAAPELLQAFRARAAAVKQR